MPPDFRPFPPAIAAALCCTLGAPAAAAAEAPAKRFDVPGGEATTTLALFARSSGGQIIYLLENVRGEITRPVRGEFTTLEALRRMLAGTALIVVPDEATGALVVSRPRAGAAPADAAQGGRTSAAAGPPPARPAPSATPAPPSSPMKSKNLLAVLAGWLALGPAGGAQTGPVKPSPPPAPEAEEAVVLSPFEVSADTDRGYQPTAVLQGGRGKIELADVAGQVTVFTREFLEDIAATTTDEAYLFSATTQTYYDNVNGDGDTRPGARNIEDDAGNSRGLGNLDKTRNFFRTSIEADAYNMERFSLVSGANAVQFGLGGAAGTSESTSVRPNLTRNRQRLSLRTDSHGSERVSFDVSQVLVPRKLAFRVAALHENKEFFLQPGYENSRRYFAAATYQPFKNTTVRVEGEYVVRRDARPSTAMARDMGYLDFLALERAGTPLVYNNRAANAGTAGRPAVPSFVLSDGTGRRAYGYSTKQWLYVWPTNTVPAFSYLQDIRNTVVTSVGDGAATASRTQTLLLPELPYDLNIAGFSRSNFRRTRNVNAIVEQRLGRRTFLELGYSYEFNRTQTAQLFASNAYDVLVDVNRYLPDGATPNPLYGRPFIESNNQAGQGQWIDHYLHQFRAVLTHEQDFTRSQSWLRHLGRHRLGFFASFDTSAEYKLITLRNLIVGQPSFLTPAARANPLHPDRAFYLRYYLPPLGSTRDPAALAIPDPRAWGWGDIMETLHFTTASGEPFAVTAYENPVGFVGNSPTAKELQRGSLATSTSSSFWRNRLVANAGVRYDRVRNSDYAGFMPVLAETPFTPQNPQGTGFRAYADFRKQEPDPVWTPYRTATRANYGFILRPPLVERWLSFGYDYSRNASLNEVAVVRDINGAVVEPAYGESHEYSVRFRLLSDRLNVKVNYFNALNRNITLANSGLIQNLISFEQRLHEIDRNYPINPLLREDAFPLAVDFRFAGDRNSKGLEVDLTFNPNPDWRIFWNLGRTQTETDDISTQPWWDYLDAKVATWRTFQGNWATAAYDETRSVEQAWDSLIQAPVETIRANLGIQGANSQTWRSNLVATRRITTGLLKGATFSANFRYRGPSIIGFPLYVDARGLNRVNRSRPYKSEDYLLTGLMANYRFRGYGHTFWRVQLNTNNVFNTRRVFVTKTFSNGSPRNYGRQAGREFILSLDLEH